MNPTANNVDEASVPGVVNDAATGLPGMRSWRRVYWLVVIVFAIYVVLLTALSKAFA